MGELAVGPRSFDDSIDRLVSCENLYKSADVAHIYRLKSGIPLAKDRKHGQVAGKLCKSLMRGQSMFICCLAYSLH